MLKTQDSTIFYDFTDSAYIGGGGLFGRAGGWDTTVRGYDVKVISFALVPGAPLVAPPLRLEPSGNYFILGWMDRWSTFIAEESGSMWGPWRPLVVQPRSIDDFSKVATPMQEPRYFRLRPRPGPYRMGKSSWRKPQRTQRAQRRSVGEAAVLAESSSVR